MIFGACNVAALICFIICFSFFFVLAAVPRKFAILYVPTHPPQPESFDWVNTTYCTGLFASPTRYACQTTLPKLWPPSCLRQVIYPVPIPHRACAS